MHTTELVAEYAAEHTRIRAFILECARADSTYLSELEESPELRCDELQAQLLTQLQADFPDSECDLVADATMQRARIVGDAIRSLIDEGSIVLGVCGCIDSSTASGIGLAVCIDATDEEDE